jgi:hypothetical protein
MQLTQGYTMLFDEEDLAFVLNHTWSVNRNNGGNHVLYASTNMKDAEGNYHTIMFHRMLFPELMPKPQKEGDPPIDPKARRVADHLTGNGLDNRKANIRVVSYRDNALNRMVRASTSKSTGKTGVCLVEPYGRQYYVAYMKLVAGNLWTKTFSVQKYKNSNRNAKERAIAARLEMERELGVLPQRPRPNI